MTKFALLALAAATLSLGACSKKTCPAYSATKAAAAPVTASTATPLVRQ